LAGMVTCVCFSGYETRVKRCETADCTGRDNGFQGNDDTLGPVSDASARSDVGDGNEREECGREKFQRTRLGRRSSAETE
jgi:hypothetical protein